MDSYRLEDVVRPVVDLVEHPRIAPHFRVKRRSACVKHADHAPGSAAELHAAPEREAGISPCRIMADDQLRHARLKEAPLHQLYLFAYVQRSCRDPANLDVSVCAGGAQGKWCDYHDL